MGKISNEQKAHNIVKEVSTIPNLFEYEAMTLCATKMAKWKDEQLEKLIEDTYTLRKKICRSETSFADCTELIKQLKLKMKGE